MPFLHEDANNFLILSENPFVEKCQSTAAMPSDLETGDLGVKSDPSPGTIDSSRLAVSLENLLTFSAL